MYRNSKSPVNPSAINPNPALNLAPFGRWTLRENTAQRRLAIRWVAMNSFSRFVSATTLCLLLAGCYETFSPIKSANVTHWQGGKPQGAAQQLTPEQIEKLSEWLQSHRWGWHPVIATYLPATQLSIKHSDGTATFANLMQKVLVVGQNQRNLSGSEGQELHSIIGAQNGG